MLVALTYDGRALHPLDPHDADVLGQAYEAGEIVSVDVKRARNIKMHRLFFALLQTVLANQERHRTIEDLLVELKVRIGHYSEHITAHGEIVYVPKSISFASMDQLSFSEFFRKAVVALSEMYPEVAGIHEYADEAIARYG